MANARSKKRFLIYPMFQLQLVGLNTAVLLGVFGFIAHRALKSFEEFQEMGVTAQLPEGHVYFKFLNLQTSTLMWNIGIGFCLSLVLSTMIILFLSHRLAGPIVRLQSYFQSLSASKKPEVLQFRKHDFFQELPPVINEAISNLSTDQKNKAA